LGLLRVKGETIALHAMRWDDEIRNADEAAPGPVEIADHEVDAAIELIESLLIDDLEGPEFVDHYREVLEEVIEAKREGKAPPEPVEQAPVGQVVDLMAALQESVQKAQASRTQPATITEMPTPKKKAPAKKTAVKKTTKKATTRKRGA
jgi:DNA end-binding protein Ku